MKRSEMIQDIASELVHEYTNFMDFGKAQELAEIILKRIEAAGMLPPSYFSYRDSEFKNLGCGKIMTGRVDHEWEPEND